MDRPRVVVYGAITGGYDLPLPLLHRLPGVDYVLLTDGPATSALGWDVRPIPEPAARMRAVSANRWCKLFAHAIFPGHDISVYVDGNLAIIGSIAVLIEEFIRSGATLGLFSHISRQTVDQEVQACLERRRFTPRDLTVLDAQVERYRAAGVMHLKALTDNAVLLRRHNAPELPDAMQAWWQELSAGTGRDQLSLVWVRKAFALDCLVWPWNYRQDKKRFAGPFPHFILKRDRAFARSRYLSVVLRRIAMQKWRRWRKARKKPS